jgi:hypothetical protein
MNRHVGKPIRRRFGDSLLHISGSVIAWIYRMAFGGLEELAYRRDRRKLIAEIEQNFSSLFSKRAGKVVLDEGLELPRSFNYVSVAIEFKEVRFRIVRGRGELCVYAATTTEQTDWQDLSVVWHRRAMRECGSPPSCKDQLGEVVQRLDANWDQLLMALATWQ